MDPRKAKVEQRIVLGLLVAFGCVVVGALKSVGVLGRRTPPARPLSQVAAGLQGESPEGLTRLHERLTDARSELSEAFPNSVGSSETPVQYTASELRDPLVSLLPAEQVPQTPAVLPRVVAAAPPKASAVTVQGMIWGGTRPQALIDGRLYNIGDVVQGARVVSIARGGVTVAIQDATFLLRPAREPRALTRRPHRPTSATPPATPTPLLVDHGR